MASRVRLIALLGAILALGAVAPIVEAAPGLLKANTDTPPGGVLPAIGPTVIDVLANDVAGVSTASRPLTITGLTAPAHGSVTSDGRSVVYNPSGCYAGLDQFTYTMTDGASSSSATVIFTVARPATAPVTDAPTAGFVSGSTMGSTVPVRVSWCGVTAGNASVRSYRVEQSTNGGLTYPGLIAGATGLTSSTRGLTPNIPYAWHVRTVDSRSRTGTYAPSLVSRVSSYQDTSPSITYSSGWKTSSSGKYSGGREHYVAKSGATATLSASNVRQFAIVASRGKGRGSFNVYVDGRKVTATAISEKSSSSAWRRVLYVGSIPGSTATRHTIQVRTASGSRVDLDAILLLSGRQTPVVSFSPLATPPAAIVNGTADAVAATSSSGLPVTLAVDPSSWRVCSLTGGTLSYQGRGTCLVNATQAADTTWNAVTAQWRFDVAGLPQAITFGALADGTYGDPDITLTATSDASPGLPVAFASQTPTVCSVTGTTASILAAGTCTVRASQPGDLTRAAATPVDRSFTVARVGLAVTGITATGRSYDGTTVAALDTSNAQLVGVLGTDDVTLVTSGAAGAFDDANVGVAKAVQVSGLTLAGTRAGDYSLTQPTATASITKASQLITFTTTAPANPVKSGPAYTAGATSDSGLPVAITVDSIPGGVCSIDGGGVVSFTGSGTCVVNADQAGDGNHNAADRQVQNLTVASTGSTPQVITFTVPGPATYGDPAVPLDAASNQPLPVTLVSLDPGVCTISGAAAVIVTAGDCRITASQAGDPTYAAALSVTRTLHVGQRAITVTAVAATKIYDGDTTSGGTPTITSGALAAGDTATWTQTYDTPVVGTGKTLTPAGTIHNGPADVTSSYDITFTTAGTGVINPGPATTLLVSGFTTPTTAGVGHSVTVTAKDAFGNTATGYAGTVHFTTSDSQAVVPVDTVLTNGTGIFPVTFKTAVVQSITATDSVTGSITGTQSSITVNPAAATRLSIALISPQTAGTPFSLTVTALDPYGNTATGYTGFVRFTTTDAGAGVSLPGIHHFTGAEAGVRTFTDGVVLVTAGTATVTATDTVLGSITDTSDPITVSAAAAATFAVAATSPQVAGTPFTVTVTARDGFGNTASGYRGVVHFTSTDGAAALPADYTYTAPDSGTHVFAGAATLATVGSRSITATDTVDSGITGTRSGITVTAAATTHFAVSGYPSPTIAGASHSVTVTAKDAFNNTVAAYAGTVTITSTDAQAGIPANNTLVAGTRTFAVTLGTVGTQTITATDTVTTSITGAQSSITVNPGAAATLSVAGYPSPTIAGASHLVTITAQDAFGNTATGYSGTVHLTSTDASASLPSNYTFAGGDAGVHDLSVTLNTVGTRSITATDTGTGSITGTQASITVSPAAAATLTVVATTSHTAGVAFTVTVTAKDGSGNTATGYTGTVAFDSTDAAAALPVDYTFTGGDAGVHVFTNAATLRTAGSQSISATDTVDAGVTGTRSGITVTAAATATLAVTGYPSPTVAGASHTVTVTARDAFNNTVTTFAGTVAITSSDGAAGLPGNNSLASGTRAFTVTLGTVGTQAITATQVGNPSITGTQSSITVDPGVATHFTVSGFASPTTAGAAHNVTVTARDAYNNTATGYAGSVHVTSSDGQAVLPSNGGLTSGTGTFPVTLKTAGTRTITAADAVTGSINGTQSSITVDPAGAATLTVTASSPHIAGSPFSVTVAAKDPYNNIATGYTGTVHFTSTDAGATLPVDYPFLVGDSGDHVFSGGMTLTEVGSQTITATDTVTGTITGTSGTITVSPGAAVDLRVTGFPASAVAGVASTVTVTALDQYGNTATGYAGTVHLTSSDTQAVVAANSTLASGTHPFAVTLKTAGTQTITATDTVNGAITGTQGGISVTAAGAADIAIEDSPAGGPAVGATPVTSGSSATFYANTVDAYGNFIANVAATWSLTGRTAGVANGDLVAAGDGKSAVFTGALVGTAVVHAVDGSFTDDSGTVTVTPGPTATVTVEDANTGSGNPIGATGIAAGGSITAYPVSRDAAGNFVGVFNSTFSLVAKTGGVVNGDLVVVAGKSAVFTGHLVGTAVIRADTAGITGDSGLISVSPGALHHIVVSPSSSTIAAGDSQAFTAEAFDAQGNTRGDVTGSTLFTMNLDGACTGASCSATLAGPHTVTGTYLSKSDTVDVTVGVGAASASTSTITAAPASIAGDGVTTSTITVRLKDQYGNALSTSGGSVTLGVSGAGGSLGSVTDHGDGTYTATYTSAATTGVATITGELDATPITDIATITLT